MSFGIRMKYSITADQFFAMFFFVSSIVKFYWHTFYTFYIHAVVYNTNFRISQNTNKKDDRGG